ncbi:4Fe-4S binding protein [Sulfurisoma sediminicola]|uniref:4Fe-4S binding protein n=1 Tax=Sulfurisoma sediminicola TaxID=1381557 RepID=A0A497X910_9PROT|nr:4Fe-4S binding protein [Sulfurisoma sediminicola]
MSIPSSAANVIEAPVSWHTKSAPGKAGAIQHGRLWAQIGFFVLFVVAPVFDIFRYDLTQGHAIILGLDWHLGLDDFFAGRITATEAGINILLRLFLPLLGGAAIFLAIAWRWGRLYCGWLCPHFSVVETINRLMRHASGKQSLWDRKPVPPKNPDGSAFVVDARWWLVTLPLTVLFAALWAIVLITYLLPPAEVYGNLLALAPTRNQALFIGVGTLVLTLEFIFARHLFCRFGCAVGLFQSLAWMGNRGAMVIGFQRRRAADCNSCYTADGPGYAACEGVCPMRLRPRVPKHQMFTCTQCGQCIAACATVQRDSPKGTLLAWVEHEAAQQNEAQVSLTGKRD